MDDLQWKTLLKWMISGENPPFSETPIYIYIWYDPSILSPLAAPKKGGEASWTQPVEQKKHPGGQAISPAQEDDFLPEDQMFKMPKNLSVQGWGRFEKGSNWKVAHVTRAV